MGGLSKIPENGCSIREILLNGASSSSSSLRVICEAGGIYFATSMSIANGITRSLARPRLCTSMPTTTTTMMTATLYAVPVIGDSRLLRGWMDIPMVCCVEPRGWLAAWLTGPPLLAQLRGRFNRRTSVNPFHYVLPL